MKIIRESKIETIYRLTANGRYLQKTKVEMKNGKYYTLRTSFPNVKAGRELEIDKEATKNHEVDVYKVKDWNEKKTQRSLVAAINWHFEKSNYK